MKVKRKMVIIN